MEAKKYHLRAKISGGFGWAFIVTAIICMAGLVVSLIMLGLGNEQMFLLGILAGSFAGGAILCGLLGYLLVRESEALHRLELDALERADSEESFFIGEETMVTFKEEGILIHTKERAVSVPYGELRFLSVCTRRKPREKGEWSVLIETPASYVVKKAKKGEPPVLIQAEGKERLYRALEKHSLVLFGERREGAQQKAQKFTRMQKYDLPDWARRKRALWFLLLGVLLAGGGAGLMFYMSAIGAPVIVVGGYIVLRAVVSYQRAKRVFAVYREGLYLAELSSQDSFFLKWEEVEELVPAEAEKQKILRANCLYGAYDFPRPDGAYEYIKGHFPEKCGK